MSQEHDKPPERKPEVVYTGSGPGQAEPPAPAEVQRLFPHLEILEVLGRGGMGVVYKARQTKLDRLVALKILAPEVTGDPAFEERFLREAKALAKLSHPNIVGVYDFGEMNGCFYLLMEFVDGAGLREVLEAGTLEPQQALAIVPQICDALQFAHEQGVVHRDIKPENILMDQQGRVRIADFGLAKMLSQDTKSWTLTQAGQAMGTPHYMAPEQITRPLDVDHRADIYSLGVVIYEMLTHELPLGRFEPPSAKVKIDVRLDEVVLRALEREPDRRYQAASEVRTDVEHISHVGRSSYVDRGIAESVRATSAAGSKQRASTGGMPSSLSAVQWIDDLPMPPMQTAGLAFALAVSGTFAIWKFDLHRLGDSMAVVYPFGFLIIVAMRSLKIREKDRETKITMRVFGFVICAFTVAVLGLGNFFRTASPILPGLSAALMVFGHLLADRWVRHLRWDSLGAALVFWVPGCIIYPISLNSVNKGEVALNYGMGIVALQFGASAMVLLPEYFIRDKVDRRTHGALLRGLVVGLVLAGLYFRKVIF